MGGNERPGPVLDIRGVGKFFKKPFFDQWMKIFKGVYHDFSSLKTIR
jgi:hypothetical protein